MSLISLSNWSIFFGWMGQGDHSETLSLLELFYQSTPSCLKVRGWWVGGPCDFSVSPFWGTFIQLWGLLGHGLGLGLDNFLDQ